LRDAQGRGLGDLSNCFNDIETAPWICGVVLRLCVIALLRIAAARDISAGTAKTPA